MALVMKSVASRTRLVAVAFAAIAVSVPILARQDHAGQDAQPPQTVAGTAPQMAVYDKATETTLTGVVDRVVLMDHDQMMAPGMSRMGGGGRMGPGMPMGRGMAAGRMGMTGLHVMLRTDADVLEVHVGPVAYLETRKLTLAAGDRISVVGSRVTIGGSPAILAREVTKGDLTVALRNTEGRPLWAGGPN